MPKKLAALLIVAATFFFAPALRAAEVPAPHIETAAAAEAKGEKSGEHELMDLDFSGAIWTLIIFVILVAILYQTAWKQVLAGLKARENRIRTDIAEAESARAKAEKILRDYNTQLADAEARGRDILNKAKTDAEALAAQIRTRSQQDAEEARERATREIEEAKTHAIREIHEQAATLATTAAEKIIRRSLNANDYRDLVDESINQLQGMRN